MKKTAIVTGATKGIGYSTAKLLASQEFNVVIVGRNEDDCKKAVESINQSTGGFNCAYVVCDISDMASLCNIIEFTIEKFERIDLLVNNAALFQPDDIQNYSLEQFDQIFAVNCKAPFKLIQLCLPEFKKVGGGCILNVSSVFGLQPGRFTCIYNMTKSALIALTKSCALDLGSLNIRSNAICPGPVKTQMIEESLQDLERKKNLENHIPSKRVGSPEEIAELISFLASPKAEYCNGSIFTIDGGFSIFSPVL